MVRFSGAINIRVFEDFSGSRESNSRPGFYGRRRANERSALLWTSARPPNDGRRWLWRGISSADSRVSGGAGLRKAEDAARYHRCAWLQQQIRSVIDASATKLSDHRTDKPKNRRRQEHLTRAYQAQPWRRHLPLVRWPLIMVRTRETCTGRVEDVRSSGVGSTPGLHVS